MSHPEYSDPDSSKFHAARWPTAADELLGSEMGARPMDGDEALSFSKQVIDKLPDPLHRNPLATEISQEDHPELRDAHQVTISRSDYPAVFAGTALSGYDQIYAATGMANLGSEFLLEAVAGADGSRSGRFFRLSTDDEDGMPVAGTINAQTGQEMAHPPTLADGLFAQDVLKALEDIAV